MIKKFIILIMMLFSVSTAYASGGSAKKVYRTDAELQSAIDSASNGTVIDLRATIDAGISFGILNIRSKNIELLGYPVKEKQIHIGRFNLYNAKLTLNRISISSTHASFLESNGTSGLDTKGDLWFSVSELVRITTGSKFVINTLDAGAVNINYFKVSSSFGSSSRPPEVISSFNLGENGREINIFAEDISIEVCGGSSVFNKVNFNSSNQSSFIIDTTGRTSLILKDTNLNVYRKIRGSTELFTLETLGNIKFSNVNVNVDLGTNWGRSLDIFKQKGSGTSPTIDIDGGNWIIKNDANTPINLCNSANSGIIRFSDKPFFLATNMLSSDRKHILGGVPTNKAKHIKLSANRLSTSDNLVLYTARSLRPNFEILNTNTFTGVTDMMVGDIIMTSTTYEYHNIGVYNTKTNEYTVTTVTSSPVKEFSVFNCRDTNWQIQLYIDQKIPLKLSTYKIVGNGGKVNNLDEIFSAEKLFEGNTPTTSVIDGLTFARDGYTPNNIDALKTTALRQGLNLLNVNWTPNTYNINYEVDGVTTTQQVTYDSTFNLNVPTKTGYTFDKWYTDSGFTTEYVKPNNWISTADINLYGKWTPNTYNINYEIDGATTTQQVTYDSAFNLNVPTKTGYTFEKWYTDSGFTTEYIKPNNWTGTADINLYGKYTPNNYNATFKEQNGNIIDTKIATYDSILADIPIFSKTGHQFKGWTDVKMNSIIDFTNKWTFAEDKEFYPVFAINKHLVEFVYNQDLLDEHIKILLVDYGNSIVEPFIKTKTGYKVEGIYKDDKFTQLFDFNEHIQSDIKLYVNIIPKKYKVKYILNGGKLSVNEKETVYNTAYELDIPTKDGYNFAGWFKENTFKTVIENKGIWTLDSDLNLYAKWVKSLVPEIPNNPSVQPDLPTTLPNIDGGGNGGGSSGQNNLDKDKDKTTEKDKNKEEDKNTSNAENNSNAGKFEDTVEHWANDKIEYLAMLGIINGYDSRFNPDGFISRADTTVIVARLLQLKENQENNTKFKDVKEDKYYYNYIDLAVKNSIIEGYGDGNFNPENHITREEFIVILDKILSYLKLDNLKDESKEFKDYERISKWAISSFNKVNKTGIINGDGNKMFNAKENITRAEVVTFIYNVIDKFYGIEK